MKNLKKILSYLMTIIIGVILFSGIKVTNALANQVFKFETDKGYLNYVVDNDEITITNYFGEDTELEIPSEINGKSVTKIANKAFEFPDEVYAYLENIKIPSSVTSIGNIAFLRCRCLKNIEVSENNKTFMDENGVLLSKDKTSLIYYPEGKTENIYNIPNSVKNIGIGAFRNNQYLRNIIIPNSVEDIGKNAFEMCSNLTDITIPNSVESIGKSAFENCSNLTDVAIPNLVENIEEYTFYQCTKLKSVIISNSVKSIGDSAFEKCANLTDITIPNSVESIGDSAFEKCANLTDITIPNSVESIGDSAFEKCANLTDITIPNSVKNIGEYAFCQCIRLKSVIISNSATSIGDATFYVCESLENVEIPNSVTSIGDYAFHMCRKLKNVTISNSVESIGVSAFRYCSNLTDITIPNSVKNIGKYAFRECQKLKNVTISNSLTSIEKDTFYECESLENIEVPNSVKSIGDSAFGSCAKLTNITIPNSVEYINIFAFEFCYNLTISGYKNSYAENYAKERSIPFKEIEIPITIESFKADKTSPQKIKTAVKLTTKATAKGTGEGILEYKYYRHLKGKYALIKDWSTSDSITIAPQKSGTYDIYVGVRDSKGNIVRKNIKFIFIDNLKIESFKADKTSPQKVQTKVKFTTKGTGEGILEYKYYRHLKGKYALIKDWSTSDSITIAPKTKGIYDIWVGIKDSSGGIVRKNIKFTFN